MKSLMPLSALSEFLDKDFEMKKNTLHYYLKNKRYLIVVQDVCPSSCRLENGEKIRLDLVPPKGKLRARQLYQLWIAEAFIPDNCESTAESILLTRTSIPCCKLAHGEAILPPWMGTIFAKSSNSNGFENLHFLKHLMLDIPSLKSLPSSLCYRPSLYTLDMPLRFIECVPDEFWKMRKLRHLNFGYISLPAHPEYIRSLIT
ncbi:hypothetical protein WN943_018450 [Citrus x changshan-huyou]